MPDYLAAGASLVLILTGLVAWFRWLRPKWHAAKHDIRAGRDALVGREAVIDTITGKQLAPPLPGIGQRMGVAEDNITSLSTAMVRLADTHHRLDSHDLRLSRLEAGTTERTLARTESIELLRTMDTAFRNNDPKEE